MKRLLISVIQAILPTSLINKFKCALYNFKQDIFIISFEDGIFNVKYPNFKVKFRENPFYLLLEQEQYFKFGEPYKGDVVLDAGGFWGTFSVCASKLVGDTGNVIVFEPDKINLKILYDNVELNNIDNIVVVEKGLWSKPGEKVLFSKGDVGSTLYQNENTQNINTYSVEVSSIDHILNQMEIDQIDFLKMDIEGSEIEALKGASQTLEKRIKVISIATYHVIDGNETTSTVKEILEMHNYHVSIACNPETITYGITPNNNP